VGVVIGLSVAVHDRDGAVTEIAIPGDESDFGVINLSGPAVATQLADEFDDMVESRHVRL
jgi:hypothetical protein